GRPCRPQVPSRTNVTCTVARYSAILPSSTAAFSFSTSMPVIPRSVLLARSSAFRTASSQLCGEAAMICVMRATAMRPVLREEGHLHLDPVLDDQPAQDLDRLADHLEPRDPADRARGARQALLHRLAEAVLRRRDDLRDPGDGHGRLATSGRAGAQGGVYFPLFFLPPRSWLIALAAASPRLPPRSPRAAWATNSGDGVTRACCSVPPTWSGTTRSPCSSTSAGRALLLPSRSSVSGCDAASFRVASSAPSNPTEPLPRA